MAKSLTADFGKGFPYANLKNFRQFYLTFPGTPIRYAVRSELEKGKSGATGDQSASTPFALRPELSWTHYRLLMRVGNEAARQYYMAESIA